MEPNPKTPDSLAADAINAMWKELKAFLAVIIVLFGVGFFYLVYQGYKESVAREEWQSQLPRVGYP